ncbi:MAG: hypothetical protein QM731_07195 [Chitinophagaceae bacterium]
MRILFFIVIVSVCLSFCGTGKNVAEPYRHYNKIGELQVSFIFNKKDNSIQFLLFNKTADTIYMQQPDLSYYNCYVQLYNRDSVLKQRGCGFIGNPTHKEYGLMLPPHRETIYEIPIKIDELFCKISPDDLLAYTYQGSFITPGRRGGGLGFFVNPVRISDIDTVVFRKVLF